MKQKDKVINLWATQSKPDFKTAKNLLFTKDYYASLFFCHLSIEKMLKAIYIAENNVAAPYTHDLRYLYNKSNFSIKEPELFKYLETFNKFNETSRYPDIQSNTYKRVSKNKTFYYLKITAKILKWTEKGLTNKLFLKQENL